jgi:hypothetical protein
LGLGCDALEELISGRHHRRHLRPGSQIERTIANIFMVRFSSLLFLKSRSQCRSLLAIRRRSSARDVFWKRKTIQQI